MSKGKTDQVRVGPHTYITRETYQRAVSAYSSRAPKARFVPPVADDKGEPLKLMVGEQAGYLTFSLDPNDPPSLALLKELDRRNTGETEQE